MRDAIEAGDLEAHRGVARALAEEFDLLDVAAAAVKLAHEPADGGPAEETDRPTAAPAGPVAASEMARVFVGAGRNAIRATDAFGEARALLAQRPPQNVGDRLVVLDDEHAPGFGRLAREHRFKGRARGAAAGGYLAPV